MRLLITIWIVLLQASCKTNTNPAHATAIHFSDTLNLPADSLTFYFPANSFHDSASTDSFVQNWYSSALYSFREPILSQNFVGHNIYRFLWLRSFHRPVVFALHQSEGKAWLNTKMLDRQPGFYDDRIGGIAEEDVEGYIKEGYVVENEEHDLVKIADRKANIIYNKHISVSDKEWREFEQLLAKANFWKLPTHVEDGATDGAQWVIEAHLKNKYHLVDRQSPYKTGYQQAGLFLINLSGIKEEVY